MPAKKKNTKKKTSRKSGKPESKQEGNSELLNMKQAIDMLKTTQPTFYRWLREGKIKGMKVGRQWRFHPEDIERFLKGEEPRVDIPSEIGPFITVLEKRLADCLWRSTSKKSSHVVFCVHLD